MPEEVISNLIKRIESKYLEKNNVDVRVFSESHKEN